MNNFSILGILHPGAGIKKGIDLPGPEHHGGDFGQSGGECTKQCGEEATCMLKEEIWHCVCIDSLQIQNSDGTCGKQTVVHNKTVTHHGVIHNEKLKEIALGNSSSPSSNETASMLKETPLNAQPDWMILQIILPVAVFLFLCFILTLICLKRHRNSRLRSKRGSDAVVKNSDNVQLLERMNIISKNPTYFTSMHGGVEGKQFLVNEIPLENLKLVEIVGEGAFGQVFKGELSNTETDTETRVAVKVLKDGVSAEIREDFEREVEIMSAFDHDNILRLLGVVTENVGESPYMIFEYMDHGDLAELLRKNDPILRNTDNRVTLQKTDLVDIATQISNGMKYLTSQHFVHRDLATRNCLVGDGLVVKISDFGMSRDIYTCDYYKIGGSRMLPVRWMAPESVKYGRFTSESDVWAYGVVLWEIFSCGRQPYYGHSNEEVIRFLADGIILQRPDDCPSTIYHIMLGCWKQDPRERMPFDKILNYLEDYNKRVAVNVQKQAVETEAVTEIVT